MSPRAYNPRLQLLVATVALAAFAAPLPARSQSFGSAMTNAMSAMHSGMTTPPTGNVDRDFVAIMVPHHQGAIDMAVAELRYGHDESLRRLAQEIIVDQEQEIAAMRLALGDPLPPPAAAPTQIPSSTVSLSPKEEPRR